MVAKKLIYQKNHNMNKKATLMVTEEIKELQEDQRRHINESVGEWLE